MRTLLCLALLLPSLLAGSALAGETCTSLVGLARHRAAHQARRARTVEKVEVDATGARVIYTAANLEAPRPFRPAGLELLRASPDALEVRLSPALARACGAETVELLVDDGLGRGRQIVHVDAGGALLLADGRLYWWGEPQPRFQMIWRSPFALDVGDPGGLVLGDLGGIGLRRRR